MWSLQQDGSLELTSTGPNTETALNLHWENTDGVLRLVDNVPEHFPYLQHLNLEGQRLRDVTALGSLLSLQELIASGNQLSDVSPLSSCLLLASLDLNDNVVEVIPAGFRSLVMLQQLLIAGNRINALKAFDVLASLPALVEISIARNPVSSLANCEEFLISRLRLLLTIDGKEVSHQQRQTITMQAAKRRLEDLEEQILLQDSNIAELSIASNRSEGLLQGIERRMTPKFEAAATMGPEPGLEKDTDDVRKNHPRSGAVKAYLPVVVAAEVPSHLEGQQHVGDRVGLADTASNQEPTSVPAHGMLPPSHAEFQAQMHTQANRRASAHGKLTPATGVVGLKGASIGDHEFQLAEFASKSRQILGFDHLDQLPQTLVEAGEGQLRALVMRLMVAVIPVFEKMLPPFRGAFPVEEMANYSAEDVVKVLTTLVPHLSAAAFQPPDTPMQQQSNHEHKMDALPQVTSCSSSSASQSQPQVTSLPQFTSTPCAHAPSTPQPKFMTPLTPQPNRAPAPQPLNTEHPRNFPYASVPASTDHRPQAPITLNNATLHELHETMRGGSFAGEAYWNKTVHFATPQHVADPSLSMSAGPQWGRYDPQIHSRHHLTQQQYPSPSHEQHYQHAAGNYSEWNGDLDQGKEADVTGFLQRVQSKSSSPQRPQDIFLAQQALARAAAEAAAAEAELHASRLRVWGVSDMSRLEMSLSANMRPTPAREGHNYNDHSSIGPQARDAGSKASIAALPQSTRAMPMSGLRGRRPPSPLGRAIEERFQQYQQAMLYYDSSLQADAQASATVCRLQDADDTAASSDWDAGILHGSSPTGANGGASTRSLALPINANGGASTRSLALPYSTQKGGVGRLPSDAKKSGKIHVPLSERFDRDSCHRPNNPDMVPDVKPGLELLRRKGGKGVKAKVWNLR